MRHILSTKALPQPRFRYSSVVCAHGFAFVSGLVGLDPSSGRLAEGGAGSETRQILDNLMALLVEQRWSLNQIVFARVFCTDMADFPSVNAEWERALAGVEPPARTSVAVQALPLQASVEIEFQICIE